MSARHQRTTQSRWGQSTSAATTIVLVLAAAGLAYVAAFPRHWLRGVLVLAVAMVVGAAFRALLPTRQAGMLAVRSRPIDVVCYVGVAGAMVVLGLWLRASGST